MPEVFEFDDDYVSTPKNGGQVAADLAGLAAEAAQLCPANAITLRPADA
jgi:ferredoxin